MNQYLVCYDISESKRLRQVFKIMKGYGDHVQYSIFRCSLSRQERVMLESALDDVIHHREDSVLIVNLGPDSEETDARFSSLGRGLEPPNRSSVVF